MTGGIARYYAGWDFANTAIIGVLQTLDPEQLALLIRPDWPIWASVAHVAGARVYWLCHVFGEPGAETTPFGDPSAGGWEDNLTHPRNSAELVGALRSTFAIIESALRTWTPESLDQIARRRRGDEIQLHTRQSVLWRMVTHDAFHAGEISLALGARGLGSESPNGAIDLWSGLARIDQ